MYLHSEVAYLLEHHSHFVRFYQRVLNYIKIRLKVQKIWAHFHLHLFLKRNFYYHDLLLSTDHVSCRPMQFSSIPSRLLPLCADFLFSLSSNSLQPHQSIFPVVFLLSLFLPFEQSFLGAFLPYPLFQYVLTILISATLYIL